MSWKKWHFLLSITLRCMKNRRLGWWHFKGGSYALWRNSYIRTGVVRYSKRQINLARIFPAQIKAIHLAIFIAWTVKRNFVDFYPYRYETMELKVLPVTLYIICTTCIIIIIIVVYTKLYISIINYIFTEIRKKLYCLNELYLASYFRVSQSGWSALRSIVAIVYVFFFCWYRTSRKCRDSCTTNGFNLEEVIEEITIPECERQIVLSSTLRHGIRSWRVIYLSPRR